MAVSYQESKNAIAAQASTVELYSEEENYILSNKYDYYSEYVDDIDFSTVDNLKNISVNSNNINVQQEDHSQFIEFRMNRYIDGFDLMNALIQIRYMNSQKQTNISKVVNVYYSEKTIKFGWLVDKNVTAVAGTLTFEITAAGTNSKGESYVWKTKPNGMLNIIEAINMDNSVIVEPTSDWYSSFTTQIEGYVTDAKNYAKQAANSAATVNSDDVEEHVYNRLSSTVDNQIDTKLENYYDKSQVNGMISNINNSMEEIDSLKNLSVSYNESTGELVLKDGEEEISNIVINSLNNLKVTYSVVNGKGTLTFKNLEQELFTVELGNADPSSEWAAAFKQEVEEDLNSKISDNSDNISKLSDNISQNTEDIGKLKELSSTVEANSAGIAQNKSSIDEVKNSLNVINTNVSGHTTDISELNESVSSLEERVDSIGDVHTDTYDVNYEGDTFTFYKNDEVERQFVITGGSGGSSSSSTITITRDNGDNIVVLSGDPAVIKFTFSSVDSSGDTTGNAKAVWKVGNTNVTTSDVINGSNSFDITKYLNTGVNNIKATFTDMLGNIAVKTWSINVVEFKIESAFDDALFYDGDVTFRYTPYGEVSKTVHFVLDGNELTSKTLSTSGRQMTYELPKQNHGSHLLKVYMTATINGQSITSGSIYKDIIWVDSENESPIVGCAVPEFSINQYNTMIIPYVVYDPKNNPANIQLLVNGEVVSSQVVDRLKQKWSYKSTTSGDVTLSIKCGSFVKKIGGYIAAIDMESKPVTTGLVLDFNPSGKNNNAEDSLVISDGLSISISDNFDETNGGYQLDDQGDTYFCVKAGTTATIPFKLFEDDAKLKGKNFKIIYKAVNVKDYDAQVLSCYESGIGFRAFAQKAVLNSQLQEASVPYYEGTVDSDPIELECNILPDSQYKEMVIWVDGIPTTCELYTSKDNFTQENPVGITVGSNDCDVWIYRIKAYNLNLSDDEILDNFICDAKNADEMINRYQRNLIADDSKNIDPDKLADVCPELRIIKLVVPSFTQGKKFAVNGGSIQQIYKGGRDVDNWTATGIMHKGQGTSSDGYGESARNIDVSLLNGIDYEVDGVSQHAETYAMTENSVPVNYFNIKVNVASSENANNAVLADDYNTFNPYLRQARKDNSKVRDTMEFHPCVIFLQETDTTTATVFKDGKMHFYACGDFGNSKTNTAVMGNDTENHKECIIEVDNNTNDLCRFQSDDFSGEMWDGSTSFEPRYPAKWAGYSEEEIQAIKTSFQQFVSWVYHADKETFRAECSEHMQMDNILFFYLYTERHCMIDNRAKNTFWHTEDLQHWDVCFNYDNDTADGNDNEGGLSFTYGLEDTDTIGSKSVFNASDSLIWCKVRDYLSDELQAMYIQLENKNAWNADRILKKFEDYQNVKPERLWIADMRRKYFRPYEDNGTESYIAMMNGSKKLQRRQFEKYQEKYIGSKYKGSAFIADKITIRAYTPETWKGVKPNGDMTIKPYADTYISVKYGSSYGYDEETRATSIRAKRGQTYVVKCPVPKMNDTETYIYNASIMESIGDISGCYPGYTDFGNAVKLTDVMVGSGVEGYSNTNMIDFGIGNNILLEKLNLQNLPELKKAIDLSGCVNLEEFLADGSGITGVEFAKGGKIKKATLPAISSFTAKKLSYLTDLTISSYDKLTSAIIEECPSIDILDFINKSSNLTRVRFTGLDWNLENTDVLDRLAGLKGFDENGYNTNNSVLTGKVHVPVMRQQKLDTYNSLWENLNVTYDSMVTQYAVTFINDNGEVLDVQYVDKGQAAVDPIHRDNNPIAVPTKKSSVSTDFTFSEWDTNFSQVFSDITVKAVYSESIRQYTVRYMSKGSVLQSTTANYGTSVEYEGDMPTYTAEEQNYKYYLFKGWDQSEVVDGNKDINAVFDSCEYTEGCFDDKSLEEMSQVELYTMMKVGIEQETLNLKDTLSLKLGIDYSFDDIEEKEIVKEAMTFSGSNYLDTGIKLMDIDRDFTLAIDYSMDTNNTAGAVLAQCYKDDGSDGFKLWNNGSARLSWNSSNVDTSAAGNREIIVLSHKKGSSDVIVYQSNLRGDNVVINTLTSVRVPIMDSTLVFGCLKADDGAYEKYCKGTIYWCKLWYASLSEKQCTDVASWIHEEIPMEIAKFKGYYLSDVSSKRCNITFIAKNLLGINRRFSNSSSTNEGGWKDSSMNVWMNKRIYNAISPMWKALIKKVKVKSSNGLKSSTINTSDSYFFIPSIYELNSDYATDPYLGEVSDPISYMLNSEERKRAKVATPDKYEQYFTRSANADYNNYYYGITGDEGTNPGNVNGYLVPSMEYGVLMMFCIGA